MTIQTYSLSRLVDYVVTKALDEKTVKKELQEATGGNIERTISNFMNPPKTDEELVEEYVSGEKRQSQPFFIEPAKLGYAKEGSLLFGNLKESSELVESLDWRPFEVDTEPHIYKACLKCNQETPLLLITKSHDNWRTDHHIAFTYHCGDVKIFYNLLAEVPFP
ncbi:MAG: hypothetical protein V3V78_04930 [Candidatus Woesearchaeota archaeon]